MNYRSWHKKRTNNTCGPYNGLPSGDQKIKELISSGELGDIIYFNCSRINLGQLKNDVSVMWDLSVHDLSIIDYLTDGAEPIKVKAVGTKAYSEKESVTFMSLDYGNFLANITASWLSPIKERRILIAGTKKCWSMMMWMF